jgi:DNA-binding XRE family transcriptional regulator
MSKISLAEALWIRLYKKRKELKLSQAVVGKYFGISQVKISQWEAGTEPDAQGNIKGKPISRELIPLVERWVELDIIPSKEELASRTNYRSGKG